MLVSAAVFWLPDPGSNQGLANEQRIERLSGFGAVHWVAVRILSSFSTTA